VVREQYQQRKFIKQFTVMNGDPDRLMISSLVGILWNTTNYLYRTLESKITRLQNLSEDHVLTFSVLNPKLHLRHVQRSQMIFVATA